MCIRETRLRYLLKVRDALQVLVDLDFRKTEHLNELGYVKDEIYALTPECERVFAEGRG